MNTKENDRNNKPEEVIELGVASIETKGGPHLGEDTGGGPTGLGISEE